MTITDTLQETRKTQYMYLKFLAKDDEQSFFNSCALWQSFVQLMVHYLVIFGVMLFIKHVPFVSIASSSV